jgi:hypothetical protein
MRFTEANSNLREAWADLLRELSTICRNLQSPPSASQGVREVHVPVLPSHASWYADAFQSISLEEARRIADHILSSPIAFAPFTYRYTSITVGGQRIEFNPPIQADEDGYLMLTPEQRQQIEDALPLGCDLASIFDTPPSQRVREKLTDGTFEDFLKVSTELIAEQASRRR